MTEDEPKYAVLSWVSWLRIKRIAHAALEELEWTKDWSDTLDRSLISDAEVIRAQDITAGPIFHMYAHLIYTFRELAVLRDPDHDKILEAIADHFAEAGDYADHLRATGRAKLPD